jgi:minor tail protein Z (GPZ)
MPVVISIKNDFKDVAKQLSRLQTKVQQKVVPAALNKVAKKAKTEMTRAITSEFAIKADEVRSRLRILRAGKSFDKWAASLDPFAKNKRGRSLNLIRFLEKSVSLSEGKKRKKAGSQGDLRFQIKRIGGKKIIKGAFIGNRGRTVFIREGDERLPIKALSTIDVPQMFNTRRINDRVVAKIRRELLIEMDRAINAVLNGYI